MKQAKHFRKLMSLFLIVTMLLSMTVVGLVGISAAEDGPTLTYSFKYDNAGYAEGRVRLTASSESDYDKYTLYWADDTKALEGYAPITTITLNQQSKSFTFGEFTAIPAGATKLIAVESALAVAPIRVDMADAVYDIPESKQFKYSPSDVEYNFQTLSDIHIHKTNYYEYAEAHFASALNAAAQRGAEFVSTCGDNTNYGDEQEWGIYLSTIANSDFTGPVYEINGNHEPYDQGEIPSTTHTNTLNMYKYATGLNAETGKLQTEPYYEITAPNGDHHIYMALELVNNKYHPGISDNFTKAQIDWLEGLLNDYKNDGKKIFIYEHALFAGYGAGDNKIAPHYGAAMTIDAELYPQTYRFKKLLEANKDIVWFSGHTHIDFKYNYNIDNENGTTAYTVHVPSSASTTTVNASGGLDYVNKADSAQGYFVDVYPDATVINGTDLVKNEILPLYTYFVDYSGEKLIENEVEGGEEESYSKVVVTVDASIFDAKSVKAVVYGADDETLTQSITMTKDTDGLYKANVSTQFTKMKFAVATANFTINSAEYTVADCVVTLGAHKVAYNNPSGWANVNVYAWNSAGGELAAWPGIAMAKEADGTFTAVIPDFPNMIIFNNGTSQTDDLDIAPYIVETVESSYTVNSTPTPPVEEDTTPVEPPVPVETVTIYFEKPASWTGAYIYGFYGVVGQTAEKIWPADYPGAAMTLVGGNTYKCEVPEDIDYIKFSDGAATNERTDNIPNSSISENAVFSITNKGSKYWNYTVSAKADVAAVGADSVTVYAINSAKWDAVSAYYWGGTEVAWPGTAMIKTGQTVNGFDVYALTLTAAPQNIIFNNNNNGSQTADLTFQTGQYFDVKSGKWYASINDIPAVSDLSTDRYLVGSFNGWSTVADEFKLKNAGDKIGYVEMDLEAHTTYEFKIVREGAWTSCKETLQITESGSGFTFSSGVSDNTMITTRDAGTYVFAFDIDTSQLAVTYPTAGEITTTPVTTAPVTTVAGTTAPTPSPETIKIYFTNNKNWENAYIYGFYGVVGEKATGEPLGVYPGKKMTYVKTNSLGEDIYSYDVPADINYIKFSDGTSANNRTDNIPSAEFTVKNGVYLTEKGAKYWGYDLYEYVDDEIKPTTAPATTTPVTTAPVTTTPVTTVPVTTAPVTTTPVTTAPVTTTPVTSAPVTSAPATTAPVTTTPVTTAPVTSAPVTSAPATTTPVTAAPATTAPVTSAPATTAPVVEPIVLLYGDSDLNDKVNIKDATLIQKHLADLEALSEYGLMVSDVDANKVVNIKDATAIQKKLADVITEFPSGEHLVVGNVDPTPGPTTAPVTTTPATSVPVTTVPATSVPTTTVPPTPPVPGELSALLASVKKTLADESYYASYVAYANLKKVYYQYKDANVTATEEATAVSAIKAAQADYNTMKTNNPSHIKGYQPPKAGTYLLRGTMNNWDESGVMSADGNGVSITYTLSAGEHKLKVYDVDTAKWYGNGGTFTDTCSGWTMSDTAGDLAFTATGGTYKFLVVFDGSKVKLTVTKL